MAAEPQWAWGVDVATRQVDVHAIRPHLIRRYGWKREHFAITLPAFEPGAPRNFLTMEILRANFRFWQAAFPASIVGVELPMNRGRIDMRLAGLSSCIAAAAWDVTRTAVYEPTPQEWKIGCGLKGNADKTDVAAFVATQGGPTSIDDNITDSWAIAYAMHRRLP